jgi:hypothetical protein
MIECVSDLVHLAADIQPEEAVAKMPRRPQMKNTRGALARRLMFDAFPEGELTDARPL